MQVAAQLIASGLAVGALYALVGLGYVIVYRATRTLNFSHGQMLMLGAIVGLQLHVYSGVSYWGSFVLVMLGMAALGAIVEVVVYRPLAGGSISSIILATAAVGSIVQSLVRAKQEQQLSYFPPIVSNEPLDALAIAISPLQLSVVGISVGIVLAFSLFFRYTRLGRVMRAVSENSDAAALVGIRVNRVHMLTWAIAGAFAGIAGLLIAPLTLISPDMGVIANKGFVAAIVGGFTSLPGTVVGGLIVGVVENAVGVYVSTAYKDVFVFLLMLAFLIVRPAGLLGRGSGRRV